MAYRIPAPAGITKETPDEVIINKLFLMFTEGNYSKITHFLRENVGDINKPNETGESIAHIIIKNSNITKQEKLDLLKLIDKYKAKLNIADKYNITPLHLAAKYQYPDI